MCFKITICYYNCTLIPFTNPPLSLTAVETAVVVVILPMPGLLPMGLLPMGLLVGLMGLMGLMAPVGLMALVKMHFRVIYFSHHLR